MVEADGRVLGFEAFSDLVEQVLRRPATAGVLARRVLEVDPVRARRLVGLELEHGSLISRRHARDRDVAPNGTARS